MTVTRLAHAKINLALSVGPPDTGAASPTAGLHPIASWFHAIDLADRVSVTRVARARSRLEVLWMADAPRTGPIDWRIDDDLARRAVELVVDETGGGLGAHVVIEKRIPVGAGLGGGSSDAAAAMLAINTQLDDPLPQETLVALSRKIGSDIAYFLSADARAKAGSTPPPPALVTGFGHHCEQLAAKDTPLVLILPPFACPTAAVYNAFDDLTDTPSLREHAIRDLTTAPPEALAPRLFNDLTEAAERVRPELARIRRSLEPLAPGPVHLTGSGSALFVLCPGGDTEAGDAEADDAEADDAEALCARFESAAPGIRAVPTRLV